MKTTRYSFRLAVIGLMLGTVVSPAAAQTAASGWRFVSPDEPVMVGDLDPGTASAMSGDVGMFRRRSIQAKTSAQTAAQSGAAASARAAGLIPAEPASVTTYRRQEAAPRPMPHAAPTHPMPDQGMVSPGSAAWNDSCGGNNGCGGGNGCADGCGSGCGGCGSGCGWFSGNGRGNWVTGVEFLYARPHFSEPTAYIRQIGPFTDPNTGNFVLANRVVSHAYDYEPSFRTYLAYQLCDCCSEVRLTYTRLDSSDSRSETTQGDIVPTFFEVQPLPGNTLTSTSDVTGNVLDLDFARCIRMGDCDSCCDGCPAWDLQWSAGARLADWEYSKDVFTNVPSNGRIDVDMDFIGAGPKIGLEGRRYFGANNQFNLYSTLDIALVLGWFKHDLRRTVPPVGVNPTSVELIESRVTRLIPVTEIELGTSWTFAPRWTVSAGWFFAAWWDLGMGETQTQNLFGADGPQFMLDDSNIMSWDGLTARIEFTW
jgi:hypothetical protein